MVRMAAMIGGLSWAENKKELAMGVEVTDGE
jgi:hypothetical protein